MGRHAIRIGRLPKAGLVIVGPLAEGQVGFGVVVALVLAVLAFGLASAAVYLGNDIVNRALDRRHPDKRWRPVASGELSVSRARRSMIVLALAGVSCGALASWTVAVVVAGYLLLNLVYSLGGRDIAVVDALCIGTGKGLRVVAGYLAVGAAPTLLLVASACGLGVLLVAVARRAEYRSAPQVADAHRRTAGFYASRRGAVVRDVAAAASVASYAAWTATVDRSTTLGVGLLAASVVVLAVLVAWVRSPSGRSRSKAPALGRLGGPVSLGLLVAWATSVVAIGLVHG